MYAAVERITVVKFLTNNGTCGCIGLYGNAAKFTNVIMQTGFKENRFLGMKFGQTR